MSSQDPRNPVRPEVVNEPPKAGPVKPGAAKPSFKVTRSPLAAKARPVGVPRPPKRPAASPNIATVPPILGRAPMGGGAAAKKETIPSAVPNIPAPRPATVVDKPIPAVPAPAPVQTPRPAKMGEPAAAPKAPQQESAPAAKASPVVEAGKKDGGNLGLLVVDIMCALVAVTFTILLFNEL